MTEGSRDHSTDSATALAVVALELLPRLRSAMEDHLDRADAVADSAVRRILGIACTDLATDLEALLGVLEASLGDESSRDRAAAASGAVAAIVARTHWPVPAA